VTTIDKEAVLKRMTEEQVTIGVDTHKYFHVAVALSKQGARLGELTVAADPGGYEQLLSWARSQGTPWCFGVEGCGSYGQGLVSHLRRHDQRVVEAGRPDRRDRRERGKSDPIDAENAARAVLAGRATGVPKSADGTSEMIREIKIARDTAVKARSQAIITLKALIVTSPEELRGELQSLSKAKLRERCAALRPGRLESPSAAAKHALRALARRWQGLDREIKAHDRLLDSLTAQMAPALRGAFGIGVDVAAEMLILAGDNPERIRSEAAFAKLCGASPIPASSGNTQRHRLNWAGHRQANSALYRSVIVRMRFHPPTIAYVKRRTAEGNSTFVIYVAARRRDGGRAGICRHEGGRPAPWRNSARISSRRSAARTSSIEGSRFWEYQGASRRRCSTSAAGSA
jgi:transposase